MFSALHNLDHFGSFRHSTFGLRDFIILSMSDVMRVLNAIEQGDANSDNSKGRLVSS